MTSFISNFKNNFILQAMLFISIMGAIPLLAGIVGTRQYKAKSMTISTEDLSQSDHLIVFFGNSRFESSINSDLIGKVLSKKTHSRVLAKTFLGGGWDSLHFYQLSLLNKPMLRKNRDIVLIEVSPLSENDFEDKNRLGAIRPEVAHSILSLAGAPLELKLDIFLGSILSIYRYRDSIQAKMIMPKLQLVTNKLALFLQKMNLLHLEKNLRSFEVITDPNNEYIIEEIRGDLNAFAVSARLKQEKRLETLKFGGYKLDALRKSVANLRDKNIDVYLVKMPLSNWLEPQIYGSIIGQKFELEMQKLANETGAHILEHWQESAGTQAIFPEEEHLSGRYMNQFSQEIAELIKL